MHSHPASEQIGIVLGKLPAEDGYRSCIRMQYSGKQSRRCRFSRTVWTEQRVYSPLFQRQVKMMDDLIAADGLTDVGGGDDDIVITWIHGIHGYPISSIPRFLQCLSLAFPSHERQSTPNNPVHQHMPICVDYRVHEWDYGYAEGLSTCSINNLLGTQDAWKIRDDDAQYRLEPNGNPMRAMLTWTMIGR